MRTRASKKAQAGDTLGRGEQVTSYSDSAATTAVNEVLYEHEGFGMLVKGHQEHAGVKGLGTLYVAGLEPVWADRLLGCGQQVGGKTC